MNRSSHSPEPTQHTSTPSSSKQERRHKPFTKEDEHLIDLQELLSNIQYQREIIGEYGWDVLDKLLDKARQQTSGKEGE